MSYTEKHLGRLHKVDLQGKSLEEWCKEQCEIRNFEKDKYQLNYTWTELFRDHTIGHQNIGSHHIIGDNVYQLIHHREVTEDFDVFWFEPDGDIQFAVEFYNGGTCLEEVMEDGVKRLERALCQKKLAIKGHPTRGNEVIELLKIMGGKICAFDYDSDGYAYYIDTSTNMIICSNENTIKHNLDKYQLFTLEEFWEKYPFKVGDKVIDEADGCPGVVCEMKWDEYLSDMKYCVAFGNGVDFGWYANDSINFFKIKKNENLEENKL